MAGEGDLQKECKDYAESRLILVRKVRAEGYNGWPDLLLVTMDGVVIFVELKNPNGKGVKAARQRSQVRELIARKANAHFVSTFEQFKEVVRRYV